MNGQVSCGSAGEYQADERAGVARLSWRVELIQPQLRSHTGILMEDMQMGPHYLCSDNHITRKNMIRAHSSEL